MKILQQGALRGANRYSRYPVISLLLDLGNLEERPSDKLPGFTECLLELIPSLDQHRCSIGEIGGFVQRLERGTWAGHIVEHVALELQCLANMEVGFGKTYDTAKKGIYQVAYRYRVESAGLYAGVQAVALVNALIGKHSFDVDTVIMKLKEMRENDMLGPSTQSIVSEAKSRNIPTMRLNNDSFVQLGHGIKQRRIQASITDQTSALGVEIADDKFRTKEILDKAGIPVPQGYVVENIEEAIKLTDLMGFPIAIKPKTGNHGRGVSVAIENIVQLEAAFATAKTLCPEVIVEKSLSGFDFRVLVIEERFVAAALREPAKVIGDGESSIEELIEQVNRDPQRGFGHERVLTQISIDTMTQRLLSLKGYALSDILAEGEPLTLKTTANLSTGGTACDVTDQVHLDVRRMCERVSRIIGLDCIGIDIIADSLSKPLEKNKAGIVEVNAAPGFRMHLAPSQGKPHNVAKAFVNMLFPIEKDFKVPIIAVTGTNGKTTTAKLIAHTLKYAGHTVGFAGTTGVEIDGVQMIGGDYSGPEGAQMVLSEPTIDHAVVEVARGGILRRGLGFESADIGVILNVDEDHIGTDDIENLDDLSKVKSVVIEVVKSTGVAVLNADDEIVLNLKNRTAGKIIYFSIDCKNKTVVKHLQSGGTSVVLEEGQVVVRSGEPDLHILSIIDAPITLQGLVGFNVENVLAATAVLFGLGVSVDHIRRGISTFHPSATQNPGRFNVIDFKTFKVIVDYGHNVPAIAALGQVLPHLTTGRKLVVAHGTGNRPDKFIKKFGAALADIYDYMIIADPDPRGRELGITPNMVKSGALENGFEEHQLEIVIDLFAATDRAFEIVQPGDLIVIQVDEVKPILTHVMKHFERIISQR